MKLPRIRALDLRPREVIIAEHNARPGSLKLGLWKREVFEGYMR